MNKWIFLAVGAILVTYFAKKHFFPTDKDMIQKRLDQLSVLLTKSEGDSVLVTANQIKNALDFFVPPVSVTVSVDGAPSEHVVSEQDKVELKNSLTAIKFRYKWLNVKFQEVLIAPRKLEADSSMTVRLEFDTPAQGRVFDLYQAQLGWKKIDGEWYISKVVVNRLDHGTQQ